METKVVKLGSSLLVPCVQELAKSQIDGVPQRYIRYEKDQPIIHNGVLPDHEVPVVDMKRLLSPESMDSELAKLHYACKDWGFFQVLFIYFYCSCSLITILLLLFLLYFVLSVSCSFYYNQ